MIRYGEYNQSMAKFLSRFSKGQKNKNNADGAPRNKIETGAMINQRYRLEAEIGRGGMGIVYRAHDVISDRDVAIKIINLDLANQLTLRQFAREVEISKQLKHPHIVEVFEAGNVEIGDDQSHPYLVMEWVDGARLDQVHNFTYARIIDLGIQLCEALQYAHQQGFVYRDLKPGNVFLEKHGFHYFVKLMDFGLARRRGEEYLPIESNLAGTVFYLAPELIAGQPADVGSDLYALGATLYEMVTGRVPFSNIDEKNILVQHLEESVTPPSQSRSDLPSALEAIILRLLEKKPENRFASAKEVEIALERISHQQVTTSLGNLSQDNYIGSTEMISEVITVLESNRLVTLLNNNTTLALAVGAHLRSQFADGVWILDFESVREPGKVLPTVASIFSVQSSASRPLVVSIVESLRQKELLLVIVNYSDLVASCAQLIETIMHACPEVHILAANSSPFNIPIEKCHST